MDTMPATERTCPHCESEIAVDLPDDALAVQRVTPYSPYAADRYDTREVCSKCGRTTGVYYEAKQRTPSPPTV